MSDTDVRRRQRSTGGLRHPGHHASNNPVTPLGASGLATPSGQYAITYAADPQATQLPARPVNPKIAIIMVDQLRLPQFWSNAPVQKLIDSLCPGRAGTALSTVMVAALGAYDGAIYRLLFNQGCRS